MFKNMLLLLPLLLCALPGCSQPSSQIDGPPTVRVIQASGEGNLSLMVAGMPLAIELSVEHAGEVTCQRHAIAFAGSQIVGYAPGSDEMCGDETVDIDWGALAGIAIKVALKLI